MQALEGEELVLGPAVRKRKLPFDDFHLDAFLDSLVDSFVATAHSIWNRPEALAVAVLVGLVLVGWIVRGVLRRIRVPGVALRSRALAKARRCARKGEHVDAAQLFRDGGDLVAAAEQYKLANLPHLAADLLVEGGYQVAAAALYERSGSTERAAQLFHDAGDLRRAEANYVAAGQTSRAAQMFRDAGELARAARLYRQQKQYRVAGELFERTGRFEEAADMFEQYYHERARTASGSRLAAESLGDVVDRAITNYEQAGSEAKALAFLDSVGHFEQAASLADKLGLGQRASQLYAQAGRHDLAADYYEKQGDTKRAAGMRAEHAFGQKQYASAARLFAESGDQRRTAEAYKADGDQARAAKVYLELGALVDAGECFAADGQYVQASAVYEKAGQYEEALRCAEAADDVRQQARLLIRLGRYVDAASAFFGGQDYERALACLGKLSVDQQAGRRAQALHGAILCEQGKYQAGVERLQSLEAGADSTQEFSATALTYYQARAFEGVDRFGEARAKYEEVAQLSPGYRDVADRLDELKVASPEAGELPQTINMSPSEMQPAWMHGNIVPGQTVLGQGRYVVVDELGRGGMGVVYRCRDTVLERVVAVKVMAPNVRELPQAIRNMHREAQSAARLNHPNIVTLYDFGEDAVGYYMIFEYVDGMNLRQFVQEFEPGLGGVRDLLVGAAKGLSYAHEQSVVHRDIKPSNVLVACASLVSKLLDFGIAKVMEEVTQTLTGIRGTPAYMSPEQITGKPVDYRTDIYSFGVMMFEMFTGERPFKGSAVTYSHVHAAPPIPTEINPQVPQPLSDLILSCLEKEPEARVQTVSEVHQGLRSLALG